MAADLTQKLPAETLNEIIAWVDDRKDLHATAHVCRRWRYVAFDHPRRFCWPGCNYQFIPGICEEWGDTASMVPAFAKLKCRSDHPRMIVLRLVVLQAAVANTVLKCLSDCMPRTSSLDIAWDTDALTQPVFDALAVQPAPILTSLSLKRSIFPASPRPEDGSIPCPRVPANILSGTAPALRNIYLTGVDLPEAPLPQFSAVTAVSFDPGTPSDSDVPWHFQDEFVRHFPALDSVTFPAWDDVRLAAPCTPEGMLLMGRLTALRISEQMLHAVLDDYPELSTIENITVDRVRFLAAQTLERLLAHFAHDDFDLETRHVSAAGAANTILSRDDAPRRKRELYVPLSVFGDVFGRARAAGHELRLVRASLCHGSFTALWPVLPADFLRSFHMYIDPDVGLPGVPPKTRPRVLPLLRNFVITRPRYTLSGPAGHITLRAGELSKFVRAALRVSGVRTITLRLEGMSVDRVTPAVERMFVNVVQERFETKSNCVIM